MRGFQINDDFATAVRTVCTQHALAHSLILSPQNPVSAARHYIGVGVNLPTRIVEHENRGTYARNPGCQNLSPPLPPDLRGHGLEHHHSTPNGSSSRARRARTVGRSIGRTERIGLDVTMVEEVAAVVVTASPSEPRRHLVSRWQSFVCWLDQPARQQPDFHQPAGSDGARQVPRQPERQCQLERPNHQRAPLSTMAAGLTGNGTIVEPLAPAPAPLLLKRASTKLQRPSTAGNRGETHA